MSDINYNFFTEQDKEKMSYVACVSGTILAGMGVGRFLGVQGVLVVGVAGFAYGLMTCKRLAPTVKNKLLNATARLNDQKFLQVLQAMREQKPGVGKGHALDMFAAFRCEIARHPAQYKSCRV